ncbi:MAG: small GTP-binding domain protein [Candidatus Lokiarchaeum sp. GC14_75]|nr:MAG: small GTP-binding domain protein [Candidatus Lokiarchaeum sp. GC14_75]
MSYRGKVILCGDASVGKTSLLAQYVDGKFSEEYQQTIGANFLIKEIDLRKVIDKLDIKNPILRKDIKEKGFKLYFWDIGGQHDKLFSTEYYFVQAVGAIVVFSLNHVESFENFDFWFGKIKELSGDVPLIVIGNKKDLNRKIDKETIEKKLKEFGIKYFETSAKLNENVDKAFESLSVEILNNLK